MLHRTLACAGLVAAAIGCTDSKCKLTPETNAGELAPAIQLRNPTSGVCEPFSSGGGGCDTSCGEPCPAIDIAWPDWAQCNTQCEPLSEAQCKATSGCRAAYAGTSFYQCWSVAPSGPVRGGNCTTLDAQECSRHDDCVAHHAVGSPIGSFLSCGPEGTTTDAGSCIEAVTCTTAAPQCPPDTIAGRRNGCWTGYCIPLAQCDALPGCSGLTEMQCIARTDCHPLYVGQNCTCTMTGCTCQSWTFDSCETK